MTVQTYDFAFSWPQASARIRGLRTITRDHFEALDNGYTSTAKWVVRRTESAERVSVTVELVRLEKPYVKRWRCSDEDAAHLSQLLDHEMSFGAFDGDRLVGVAITEPRRWNNTVWVDTIYVDLAYRGKGIGSRLCNEVESVARRNGFRIIGLETQNTNAPAVAFYTKMGFVLDGLDVSFYSNNENLEDEIAFFMKKHLA